MLFHLYELAVGRRDELIFVKGINSLLKIEKDAFCSINFKHGKNGLLNSSFLRIGMIQKRKTVLRKMKEHRCRETTWCTYKKISKIIQLKHRKYKTHQLNRSQNNLVETLKYYAKSFCPFSLANVIKCYKCKDYPNIVLINEVNDYVFLKIMLSFQNICAF